MKVHGPPVLLVLLLGGGCFQPALKGVACANDGSCPPGQECERVTDLCVPTGTAECLTPPCREPVAWVWGEQLDNAVDVLLLVDNSGSMSEEQSSLASSFAQFTVALEQQLGALPDLHIGVISTDAGVGLGNGGTGCSATGDNGGLRTNPACGVSNAYIIDRDDGAGGRVQNYSSGIDDTIACVATLGINGCGFEQPLESLWRAVNGSNPANAGFLREGALLAVHILSDEDDCSVSDTAMFDTTQNDIDAPLGPLSSYRCFEFGVSCDCENEPCEPRSPGARTNCRSQEDSQYMSSVSHYAERLKELKGDRNRDILITATIGDPDPVSVSMDTENDIPKLDPSCASASGEAAPGVRLQHFVDEFAMGASHTICNPDLGGSLIDFGNRVAHALGSSCIPVPIDGPDDCIAEEVGATTRTTIPVCNDPVTPASSSNLPCYAIGSEPDRCGVAGLGLTFEVFRAAPLPVDSYVQLRCMTE